MKGGNATQALRGCLLYPTVVVWHVLATTAQFHRVWNWDEGTGWGPGDSQGTVRLELQSVGRSGAAVSADRLLRHEVPCEQASHRQRKLSWQSPQQEHRQQRLRVTGLAPCTRPEGSALHAAVLMALGRRLCHRRH